MGCFVLMYFDDGVQVNVFAAGSVIAVCARWWTYVMVKYKCVRATPKKSRTICEHERGTISCGYDETLMIIGANYGRKSRDICPSPRMRRTDCRSVESLKIVDKLCEGKTKCKLTASNQLFFNPCVGTYKYLKVSYNNTKTYNTQNNNNNNTKNYNNKTKNINNPKNNN